MIEAIIASAPWGSILYFVGSLILLWLGFVIKDVIQNKSNLITKIDLNQHLLHCPVAVRVEDFQKEKGIERAEDRIDRADLRNGIRTDMASYREEIQNAIISNRTEMHSSIRECRNDIVNGFTKTVGNLETKVECLEKKVLEKLQEVSENGNRKDQNAKLKDDTKLH